MDSSQISNGAGLEPNVYPPTMELWARKGSNLRPRSYKGRALPLSYWPIFGGQVRRQLYR